LKNTIDAAEEIPIEKQKKMKASQSEYDSNNEEGDFTDGLK